MCAQGTWEINSSDIFPSLGGELASLESICEDLELLV